MKRKLILFFNKYFVYKGYIVIHHSDGSNQVIGFAGYKDFLRVKKHYLNTSDDYSVFIDRDSDVLVCAICWYVISAISFCLGKYLF